MAPDIDQQRGVVDVSTPRIVQSHPLGQAKRDEALAQDVFHRLAEAEVDPQRERRDQLGESHIRPVGRAGHACNVLARGSTDRR